MAPSKGAMCLGDNVDDRGDDVATTWRRSRMAVAPEAADTGTAEAENLPMAWPSLSTWPLPRMCRW